MTDSSLPPENPELAARLRRVERMVKVVLFVQLVWLCSLLQPLWDILAKLF